MKHYLSKLLPLIPSIALFVLSCGLFAFLYSKIENNNTQANQMLSEWQTASSAQENLLALTSSIKSIDNEKSMLETHFAKSSDVVPFLDMIEKLAPKVGTKAEVVLVNVSADNTGLVVEVKATGSFESIYKFVTLLENSPYELEVDSLHIQKMDSPAAVAGTDATPSQWSADMTLKLLSFIN